MTNRRINECEANRVNGKNRIPVAGFFFVPRLVSYSELATVALVPKINNQSNTCFRDQKSI